MVLSEIRTEARGLLEGRWVNLVPLWLIYFFIACTPTVIFRQGNSGFQFGINLIIGGPFAFAIARIALRLYHKEGVEIGQLFEGFKEFTRNFIAYLLITLYVILWSLLLIIPGIIAGLGYSMTYFIMSEDPDIKPADAMRQSKQMMMGHKTDLFLLGLSFLGWLFLAILTLGIGLFWLESYIMTSYAIFYKRIKGIGVTEEVVQPIETIEPGDKDSTI